MLNLCRRDVERLLANGFITINRPCHDANDECIDIAVDLGDGKFGNEQGDITFDSPYGAIGSTLKVAEQFRVASWRDDGRMAFDYEASPEIIETPWVKLPQDQFDLLAKQSLTDCEKSGLLEENGKYGWKKGSSPCRWRASDEMPELASRLTAKLTAQEVYDGNDGLPDDSVNMRWRFKFELVRSVQG